LIRRTRGQVPRQGGRGLSVEGLHGSPGTLPLYTEDRESHRPTAEQILRLFAHVEGHVVMRGNSVPAVLQPVLSERQRQVLELLGVPKSRYAITP
jgi:hypothetical protein